MRVPCRFLTRGRALLLLLSVRRNDGKDERRGLPGAFALEIERLLQIGYVEFYRRPDLLGVLRVTSKGTRFIDRRIGKEERAKRKAGLALAGSSSPHRT